MKKNDQNKKLLLEQLSKTPIIQIACEKLGIARPTFYRWKAQDKEFGRQVDEAIRGGRLLVNDLAESQLISAVKDRNIQAVMYWLKHHHVDYRNRLEIDGNINTSQELSLEQQTLIKKALEFASFDLEQKQDIKTNENDS
ncbi:MAG: hypothetical protein WCQ96_01055 [Patescibacteria group bacterium]